MWNSVGLFLLHSPYLFNLCSDRLLPFSISPKHFAKQTFSNENKVQDVVEKNFIASKLSECFSRDLEELPDELQQLAANNSNCALFFWRMKLVNKNVNYLWPNLIRNYDYGQIWNTNSRLITKVKQCKAWSDRLETPSTVNEKRIHNRLGIVRFYGLSSCKTFTMETIVATLRVVESCGPKFLWN